MTGGASCTNCGETLAGRYCHACGQDSIPPETALASWHGHWQRLWRTLYALVLRPGLLTREHLSGGRVRFIAPFTLFLNIVTIFFLFSVVTEFRLQSFVNKDTTNHIDRAIERRAREAGVDRRVFLERAERRFQGVYTVCLATISLAGYTLLFRLFFRRQWQGFRGPFTLALHYLAFVFLVFPFFMAGVSAWARAGPVVLANAFGLAVTFCLATAWLALASRCLFAERWPWAVGKGAAIVFVGFFLDNAMFLAALILTLNLT